MTSLLALALAYAGREERGAMLVPASNLAAFLDAAHKAKIDIPYIECLYLGPGSSVEPSLDVSRAPADFPTWNDFIAFASSAALIASERAETGSDRRGPKGAQAVFEVGPSPT